MGVQNEPPFCVLGVHLNPKRVFGGSFLSIIFRDSYYVLTTIDDCNMPSYARFCDFRTFSVKYMRLLQ